MSGAWQEVRHPKARKPHTCDWCQTVIVVGETYAYWFGLADESYEVAQTRAHSDCWDAITREARAYGWEDVCWFAPHRRGMTTEETEAQVPL